MNCDLERESWFKSEFDQQSSTNCWPVKIQYDLGRPARFPNTHCEWQSHRWRSLARNFSYRTELDICWGSPEWPYVRSFSLISMSTYSYPCTLHTQDPSILSSCACFPLLILRAHWLFDPYRLHSKSCNSCWDLENHPPIRRINNNNEGFPMVISTLYKLTNCIGLLEFEDHGRLPVVLYQANCMLSHKTLINSFAAEYWACHSSDYWIGLSDCPSRSHCWSLSGWERCNAE